MPDGIAFGCAGTVACGPDRISWDSFVDDIAPITSYAYLIAEVELTRGRDRGFTVRRNVTPIVNVGLTNSQLVRNLRLVVRNQYVVRVFATNAAGLVGNSSSIPLTIAPVGNPISSSTVAIIVAASIGVSSVLVALATVYIVRMR